tara:strand:- start:39 stop:257 length:219 start_codon:yes stop_codon:yes gene_type:complete
MFAGEIEMSLASHAVVSLMINMAVTSMLVISAQEALLHICRTVFGTYISSVLNVIDLDQAQSMSIVLRSFRK